LAVTYIQAIPGPVDPLLDHAGIRRIELGCPTSGGAGIGPRPRRGRPRRHLHPGDPRSRRPAPRPRRHSPDRARLPDIW
ncbi:hypothetical protein CTI14_68850, partial [Methylobacterium radiotolerans]